MPYTLSEWLNLAIRWFHIFAAMLWIGQTYFFAWLDRQFTKSPDRQIARSPDPPHSGVWMVHSGGFYVVEKRPLGQTVLPELHWFKWEAALTWISGMLLLILVYYHGSLLIDASAPTISHTAAIGIGVALLVVGWLVYDFVWTSPISRNEPVAVVVCYALLVGVAWALTQVMSGRAAYIHVGALMGTIMTGNVWSRILPGQQRMLAAVASGKAPDLSYAETAKKRSKHNTFMVVPVVMIMISNHFPVATYGHRYNWLILAVLILVGWGAAAIMRKT